MDRRQHVLHQRRYGLLSLWWGEVSPSCFSCTQYNKNLTALGKSSSDDNIQFKVRPPNKIMLLKNCLVFRKDGEIDRLFSFPLVASLACGWTETCTTAGVTPVKHLGTPCSQKRRISMCRTQRSGLLNNKTLSPQGKKKQVLQRANGGVLLLQNNGNVPNLTAHHQGSPGRKPAIGCLLCVTTAVITELFFFVKNYLCVYLVTALCSVFAEQGECVKQ